jgi:hypothetical protein
MKRRAQGLARAAASRSIQSFVFAVTSIIKVVVQCPTMLAACHVAPLYAFVVKEKHVFEVNSSLIRIKSVLAVLHSGELASTITLLFLEFIQGEFTEYVPSFRELHDCI